MTQYQTRPTTATAIQWAGSNEQEIINLVGNDFEISPEEDRDDHEQTATLRHWQHGHYQPVYTGDWIVKQHDGRVVRLSPKEFNRTYEPATGEQQ